MEMKPSGVACFVVESRNGIGHLSRCAALSGALRCLGVRSQWACESTPAVVKVLKQEADLELIGPEALLPLELAHKVAQWAAHSQLLVFDSYHVTSEFLAAATSAGCHSRIILFDDHQIRTGANLRIAPMQPIELAPDGCSVSIPLQTCATLQGTQFLLLREEFATEAQKSRLEQARAGMLVCMGGADGQGITLRLLQLLLERPELVRRRWGVVNVLASDKMAEEQGLDELVQQHAGMVIRIPWVDAAGVALLLQQSAQAVVSCSGIACEAIAMNCPTIAVHWVDNQLKPVEQVNHATVIETLGVRVVTTVQQAVGHLLSDEGLDVPPQGTIDTHGVHRVAAAVCAQQLTAQACCVSQQGFRMSLRVATFDDAQRLVDWRNDPATRAGCRSTSTVHWESHLSWLAHTIGSADRVLLMCEVLQDGGKSTAVGTVRFDRLDAEKEFEISWTVAPEWRGKKLSQPMVSMAITMVSRGTRVVAEIKESNLASRKVAVATGFTLSGPVDNGNGLWVLECGTTDTDLSILNTSAAEAQSTCKVVHVDESE